MSHLHFPPWTQQEVAKRGRGGRVRRIGTWLQGDSVERLASGVENLQKSQTWVYVFGASTLKLS